MMRTVTRLNLGAIFIKCCQDIHNAMRSKPQFISVGTCHKLRHRSFIVATFEKMNFLQIKKISVSDKGIILIPTVKSGIIICFVRLR